MRVFRVRVRHVALAATARTAPSRTGRTAPPRPPLQAAREPRGRAAASTPMTDKDNGNGLEWAMPVMRAGYAGRGLIYVIVAVLSLLAIWRGDTPDGTSDALQTLETSAWGIALLGLTALGLLAYALWRVVAAAWDLEDHGQGAKGMAARAAQAATGLAHLVLAASVFGVIFTAGGGGDGSRIAQATRWLMGMPFGRALVAAVGLILIGTGAYYLRKGITRKYMENLRTRPITLRLRPALTAGLVAQGAVLAIIGGLFALAALQADPDEAGGLGAAFDWLRDQPYGTALVSGLAAGLLAFALFCFVNAAFRIVPKLRGDDVETLRRTVDAMTG